jgi:recombination protein U
MGISVEEYKKILEQDSLKNPKRQLQGKVNRELGKQFEETIELICNYYENKGIALIEKTPEPMKILKHIDNGHFETIFSKSAQPDFKGTISGGKTVVFDAKFTLSDRISYNALSDYQRETLSKYDKLGANAFVLVGFSDGKMFNIDINTWKNMKNLFGRNYIKEEELIASRFSCKSNDFLNIL